jgi:hypothetical protein
MTRAVRVHRLLDLRWPSSRPAPAAPTPLHPAVPCIGCGVVDHHVLRCRHCEGAVCEANHCYRLANAAVWCGRHVPAKAPPPPLPERWRPVANHADLWTCRDCGERVDVAAMRRHGDVCVGGLVREGER